MSTKPSNKSPAELLARLEDRHDQLLGRLDELNAQIEAALVEVTKPATPGDVG